MESRAPRVKNKGVAQLQISAEQILQEAYERKEAPLERVSDDRLEDLEELHEYQGRKRREYENALRRNKQNFGQWMRYAQWELDQREIARAQSVFERALEVDATHVPMWIRYIQCELKERNIAHAKNLLDRAVTTLPRVDKLWFTYVSTLETLGDIVGCRQVFERWMAWRPEPPAWGAYINMEKRYNEVERARAVFDRLTIVHPQSENWIKWAKFENEMGSPDTTRQVYTLAVDTLMAAGTIGENDEEDNAVMARSRVQFLDQTILCHWAKWEARQKEWERARAIYTFGLERLPKSRSKQLYDDYSAFEKQYGEKEGIENVILAKRRAKYEEDLKTDPHDYDTWFSYLSLVEELSTDYNDIRDIYERAIANVPRHTAKRHWRRYIFLWIRYALWEELETGDIDRTRQVYSQCIQIIPHKVFTFAKVWLLFAKFEIRHGSLSTARKILGQSIGITNGGKPKLFKGYIELEVKLKEFDRVRKLYEKYLQTYPELSDAWIEYGTLEQQLGDEERARAILALAISQPEMEMPELVWKRFIEFETEEGNYDNARQLYEELLEKTNHVKVWISYALFEITITDGEEEEEDDDEVLLVSEEAKDRTRSIFQRAWDGFKDRDLKEQRVIIYQAWREFEETHGTAETLNKLDTEKKPNVVKKRRELDDGTSEEFLDYVFPGDEKDKKINAFLENAKKWKEKQDILAKQREEQGL
ncbi:Pre-mRNA-splicing factor CLF1 [Nadsonia fulvescens var. elongata DSM 6958]|uniref:Pre-mRNA-splicing factor CLF1 n=1 Tax=Nadsonia fulvescens var. elongata DSM 6958 TaxID=857566 RepID=A0A1E3PT36_9ASCO|nr:Pre-mRNA-splicing factor CLF1 [Nadsonia fulvescens var. elongata DSM 6958]